MKFTYLGHAAFLIETQSKKLLFDPFITGNPLSRGKVDVEKLEPDYIFITHAHGDHLGDVLSIARRSCALCVASAEVAAWLTDKGVASVLPINYGGAISFPFGTVRAVNAIHSSSFPDGKYGGNPMGFLLGLSEGNFYYSGDTSLCMDMKLIPRWGKLSASILPIGGNFTMDVQDALQATEMLECNVVIGIHYNTFDLIKINKDEALNSFRKSGKQLLLPEIGQTIEL